MIVEEQLSRIINKRFDPLQQKADDIQSNIEWTERAIEHFGTTMKPHEAGFILYDGQMLDFSGGYKDERRIDHQEIHQLYTKKDIEEENKKYGYGERLYHYTKSGIIHLFQLQSNALRINVDRYGGYIYISMNDTNHITPSQIETLKYIETYDTKRHILYDVYDKDGNSIKHNEVNSVKDLIYSLKMIYISEDK